MAVEITMPQLSDTMHEGKILTWLKKEGEAVKRGEAIAEVATDKADLEVESFHHGVILQIKAQAGTSVKVGEVIALIGEANEQVSSAPVVAPVAVAPIAVAPIAVAPAVTEQAQFVPQSSIPKIVVPTYTNGGVIHDERVKISPLAKNIAESQGIDISTLHGTGEGGRITKRDVERVAAPALAVVEQPVVETTPRAISNVAPREIQSSNLSKMRSTIAERMVQAKTTIPHFYMTSKLVVDELLKMRGTLKTLPQYEGLTVNHLIVKAVGLALKAVPRVNANYSQGSLLQPAGINIGIVTAVTDGLLIPVLKQVDELPLSEVVSEGKALVQRARAGKPKGEDLMGGTFSVSNIGTFPVEEFAAIISPGQGGILAVGSIAEEAIVKNGELTVGNVMRVTISVDHRIIDGIVAGEFLQELKRLIEDPVLLLA
jgi:pyruvate dehydrogenase E2 component (dihydrolipoamide acetyltransferase)